MEERFDLLEEIFNGVEDWSEKVDVFDGSADISAACYGKLSVLKWLCTKGLYIDEESCAGLAARHAHLHINQWLREEKGLELNGRLYAYVIQGGKIHVMKWLREQEVDWDISTFIYAAEEGNLEVLQWLHDEGCPWDRRFHADERRLKPEALDWLRVNGYGDRVSRG
eukprot:CAMPEP_0178966784 /NCGR_PEP_ID=MMETSP0789-20121207/17128_1 /TAXON_ID=3005 /ORGANISM="Rhizosolenia setigera, Strain CCMP 1694" /LENGTH=166 /DNA_ID=CAMNT_0020652115 /DNA_START=278 /DNA_END=778 /DNA_ORIENTATION=-